MFGDTLVSVSEKCSASVIENEDRNEAWRLLKEQLNAVSTAAYDSYMEEYHTMKMKPSDGKRQYVNRLTIMECRSAANGKPICRGEKRRPLWMGLCYEYENIAGMIRERDKDRSASVGILITNGIAIHR